MNKYNELKTVLKLTAITSGFVYVYNQFIVHNAMQKNMLARTTNKKYYHAKDCNIFYTIHGKGSPVLLIHDLTAGSSGYEWNRIEKELSKKHTVYTIDLPGCGRSEKKKQIYTNAYFVQIVSEFIRNVIRSKTNIITSGYSASIAVMIYKQNSDLINKILLVNPNHPKKYSRTGRKKNQIFFYILHIPVFGTLIYHMIVSRETIENLFIENYYYNPFHLDTDLEDAYYEAAHRDHSLSKYLYASLVRNDTRCNFSQALKDCNKNDIRIIFGESEPNCKDLIFQYQDIIPEISAAMIRHTKHFPHVEKPKTFLNQVEQFF